MKPQPQKNDAVLVSELGLTASIARGKANDEANGASDSERSNEIINQKRKREPYRRTQKRQGSTYIIKKLNKEEREKGERKMG